MTYGELLSALQKLTVAELERPARVRVCDQALTIRAVVDEGDGPPMLDTAVNWIDIAGVCE